MIAQSWHLRSWRAQSKVMPATASRSVCPAISKIITTSPAPGGCSRPRARTARCLPWRPTGGLNNASAYIGLIPELKIGVAIPSNRGDVTPFEIARNSLLPGLARTARTPVVSNGQRRTRDDIALRADARRGATTSRAASGISVRRSGRRRCNGCRGEIHPPQRHRRRFTRSIAGRASTWFRGGVNWKFWSSPSKCCHPPAAAAFRSA
jgi:hypothetical protein